MLRTSSRLSQAARFVSACRHASTSDAAFRLIDPLPNTAQVGQVAPPTERKLSEFNNGIYVAATTSNSPLCTVNIVVKAGSRYELPGEEGLAHFMRRLAYKSTDKHTAIYMTCLPQWYGMKLSCTGTRESIVYSGTCLKDDVDNMLDVMCQTIVAPKIYNWEVHYTPAEHDGLTARLIDARQRVAQDNGGLVNNRAGSVINALQNHAFRGGLSQSVFCPDHRVGNVDEEHCVAYHKRRYLGSNIGVFAAGVHPDDLVTSVTRHGLYNLPKGDPLTQQAQGASKFTTGNYESRIQTGDSTVIAGLVGQGASLTDEKQHISSLLFQRMLGSNAPLESGVSTSRLQVAADKAVGSTASAPPTVSSLNINFSDAGLFGMQVEAGKSEIRDVLKAATAEFTRASSGVTEKELKMAKAQLKADLAETQESHAGIVEDMAYQVMYRGGKYLVPEKVAERVEAVTLKDVKSFAQSVVQSKHVLVQHGNLNEAPHLDELGL
ncbi:cytochrome b-c1 complex subunit 2, mitochondrial-like [Sycon ciliatum]|uniref:cytochrome b-c1 complex subunit 2, mitochondrial-like n=1 Tax=Sycon ciliatum TaxID=27933 RepID=UPI0031F6588B